MAFMDLLSSLANDFVNAAYKAKDKYDMYYSIYCNKSIAELKEIYAVGNNDERYVIHKIMEERRK